MIKVGVANNATLHLRIKKDVGKCCSHNVISKYEGYVIGLFKKVHLSRGKVSKASNSKRFNDVPFAVC